MVYGKVGMLVKPGLHRRLIDKRKVLDAHRPLPPEVVNEIQQAFRIRYTYDTNAIEGNTLSLRETQLLIEEGQTFQGAPLRDLYEAKNSYGAIQYVEKLAKKKLTESNIFTLHQILMKETVAPKYIGKYRSGESRITGSEHIPPPAYEVPRLIEELIDMMNHNPDEYVTVELAARVLHRLVYIHPFRDGNGRMARLLANLVLMKNRYTAINIQKVDRAKYLNYLVQADTGNYASLVNFMGQYVDKHLDILLDALQQSPETRKISLKEAASISPYSHNYLRLLANRSLIPATKEGRNWVIRKSDLFEYIKRQKRTPAS